ARKWLAPGTTSLRSLAGSAQLRCDSSAMVTDCDQASVLVRRVRGETIVGANCLRAVTTSHTESPHRPLSVRRRATSATARWPRTDWSRASRYRVVLRQRESAACGGNTDASHRIQASFMTAPCSVAPAARHGRVLSDPCHRIAERPGVLGRAAALSGALAARARSPRKCGTCRFPPKTWRRKSWRTLLPDFETPAEQGCGATSGSAVPPLVGQWAAGGPEWP